MPILGGLTCSNTAKALMQALPSQKEIQIPL